MLRRAEAFYSPVIRVSLLDLWMVYLTSALSLPCPLRGTGWLECTKVGYLTSLDQLDSDKTPTVSTLIKPFLLMADLWWFENGYSPPPSASNMKVFSSIYCDNLIELLAIKFIKVETGTSFNAQTCPLSLQRFVNYRPSFSNPVWTAMGDSLRVSVLVSWDSLYSPVTCR